jgi:SAM-dependent methyltransferase
VNDAASEAKRWQEYYAATESRPPRDTVIKALEFVPSYGRAIDLGCGCGHDTIAMLKHGLHVTAVDVSEEATARTIKQAQHEQLNQRLQTFTRPFERVEFGTYNLINAAYSLPFCDPDEFPGLWERLRAALLPDGVFAGQFFGVNDQWNHEPGHHARIFLTRREVDRLTNGLERLHFEEFEGDSTTATGKPRYHHVFHVVLRNR